MSATKSPFNIAILQSNRLKATLPEVTTLDITDGQTANFHPEGLYSAEIFGRVGEEERDKRFAFIDMKVQVLHPTIFKTMTRMRALYKGILSGKLYAVWDDKEKDFFPSNQDEGETGFQFFMSHYKDIKFKRNSSKKRDLSIDLIEKERENSLVRYLIVIPAGLRDIIMEEEGRTQEDEINDKYRRAISIARTVDISDNNPNNKIHDTARWSMQQTFNEIYEILRTMLEGKKGFIQGKWGRRKVFNGTRNVISAMNTSASSADDPKMPDVNDTMTGLYQAMKGCLPITIWCLRNRSIIGEVFNSPDGQVELLDKKTLQPELVSLDPQTQDLWSSTEGLERLISGFSDIYLRHKPIEVEGRYLGLIYDDGTYVKVVRNLNDVPDSVDRKRFRPVTWAELMYLAVFERFKDIKVVVTRYPVTGLGSTYPSNLYLRTTINGLTRTLLDDEWDADETSLIATEMPDTLNEGDFMDAGVVHTSRLRKLGGDYDGRVLPSVVAP